MRLAIVHDGVATENDLRLDLTEPFGDTLEHLYYERWGRQWLASYKYAEIGRCRAEDRS